MNLDAISNYPVHDYIKERAKGGVTLFKSGRVWVALIVMENGDLRLYKWELRGGAWKVALARFNIRPYADKLVEAINSLS